MSPVPLHVVETERVQGPLTLSETRTWPVTLYWLNQPTRRSPGRTGSRRVRVYDLRREAGEAATPWTNSIDTAGVVTLRGADGAEWAFTRSKASTEYVWVVVGVTSESRKIVVSGPVVPMAEPSRCTV